MPLIVLGAFYAFFGYCAWEEWTRYDDPAALIWWAIWLVIGVGFIVAVACGL